MSKTTSKSIEKKEKQYIAKTQKIPYYPVAFKSGKGAMLYDFEGNEYVDFLASAGSANIGHGNKELSEAVKEQMDDLTQYTLAYFNSEPPIRLAEKLVEIAPGDNNKKVLYSATGSACIDAAIKLSRAFTGRTKIISFFESYHGSTFGAMSISALSTNMRRKMGPLLSDIYHFNYPACCKCPYSKKEKSCSLECVNEIEFAFDHYLPSEEVAAIFIEPIAGDAGIIVPPKKWVKAIRELCDKYGIVFVCDEIQQGMGRTGKWFGIENFDVEADLLVLGKSVGGGLPLGAVVGKTEILESLDAPAHVFTLSGNTTVCVAALKSIEILERENALQNSLVMGDYIKAGFEKLKEKYDIIGDIRGIGLSIGVDIVKGKGSIEKNPDATTKICYRCIQTGLVMIFLGQSTLRVQPPLVITREQVEKAMGIIDSAINDYLNDRIGDEVYEVTQGW
ncbi:aminotransferase class III-fold pyridoxal phosphate-dependent enzyme [Metaclostridioides mangenotii]|uniref:aminotransferase class III-fold pyridoxal phosphate-dependent enzyme n=1 Tax=Metaclostridioides mangenotii TaxID=1540 RepID=UPI0026EE7079|nr:aminotransferase class III-fold pyridoxal phosphate-dependent enzyme [Clostridioides mangenotii]